MVAHGKAAIGRVARQLKTQEEKYKLSYRVFAYAPVVIAANLPQACVDNLSKQQVLSIYNGTITDWSQLNERCRKNKIYVATREKGDSSRTVLESWLPELKRAMGSSGQTVFSSPELVRILESYPYTIGYAPLAMLDRERLTVFNLDGVAPTRQNIQQGGYLLQTPLGIVWKGVLQGEEKRFVDFLLSERAQKRIAELGLVPVR
jgi:phosphate transport system substrate-binding protein